MATRLQQLYESSIRAEMRNEFNYTNPMQVPKLEKIVINMGVGEASQDRKKIEGPIDDLTRVSGQKPVVTRAKKSIAGFKLRDNMIVGAKVTLRKNRMYEFLDRLINMALPRVRDFRGVNPRSFDGNGNYAMGVREQIVFRRLRQGRWSSGHGHYYLHHRKKRRRARALLRHFNMPFTGFSA